MVATAQTTVNSSTGNGVTTVFPYAFKILREADLQVLVDDVVQTLSTHYTLSGVGAANGGNITFLSAPASGARVVRRRNMALERPTDYQYQGDLPNDVLNADQDAPVMMIQQLQEQIGRGLRGPAGEVWGEMPAASSRRDLLQVFDAVTGLPALSTFTATQVASAVAAAFLTGSTLAAQTFLQAGTGAVPTDGQTKLREAALSPEDFGAAPVGDSSVSDSIAVSLCMSAAVILKRKVTLLRPYYLSEPLQIPHRLRVEGVSAWSCGFYPLNGWAPSTATYLVQVLQNPGGSTSDTNFFCNWSDFFISAKKVTNLGCLDCNAGAGSTIERVYMLDGGANVDQVRWTSAATPGGGATVAQAWRNVWVGSSDGVPVCRNGVLLSGSGYSLHLDTCVFDYLSAGVSGTHGFALKLMGAGITITCPDMEGNPSPIYCSASGITIVGGHIKRTGLGSAPSTDADFAIEVATNENNMPNLIGVRVNQGYGSDGGSGGVAKINGGAALTVARSTNGELTYFNTRAFTVQGGARFGNTARTDPLALDWYEEGTWTPVVFGVSSAGAGTYTVQAGFFTRIGNRVFFNCRVGWSAHTGTGVMRISGLPYTPSGTSNDSVVSVIADSITYSNQLAGLIFTGAANIRLYQQASGAALDGSSELPIDTAGTLYISGNYRVG